MERVRAIQDRLRKKLKRVDHRDHLVKTGQTNGFSPMVIIDHGALGISVEANQHQPTTWDHDGLLKIFPDAKMTLDHLLPQGCDLPRSVPNDVITFIHDRQNLMGSQIRSIRLDDVHKPPQMTKQVMDCLGLLDNKILQIHQDAIDQGTCIGLMNAYASIADQLVYQRCHLMAIAWYRSALWFGSNMVPRADFVSSESKNGFLFVDRTNMPRLRWMTILTYHLTELLFRYGTCLVEAGPIYYPEAELALSSTIIYRVSYFGSTSLCTLAHCDSVIAIINQRPDGRLHAALYEKWYKIAIATSRSKFALTSTDSSSHSITSSTSFSSSSVTSVPLASHLLDTSKTYVRLVMDWNNAVKLQDLSMMDAAAMAIWNDTKDHNDMHRIRAAVWSRLVPCFRTLHVRNLVPSKKLERLCEDNINWRMTTPITDAHHSSISAELHRTLGLIHLRNGKWDISSSYLTTSVQEQTKHVLSKASKTTFQATVIYCAAALVASGEYDGGRLILECCEQWTETLSDEEKKERNIWSNIERATTLGHFIRFLRDPNVSGRWRKRIPPAFFVDVESRDFWIEFDARLSAGLHVDFGNDSNESKDIKGHVHLDDVEDQDDVGHDDEGDEHDNDNDNDNDMTNGDIGGLPVAPSPSSSSPPPSPPPPSPPPPVYKDKNDPPPPPTLGYILRRVDEYFSFIDRRLPRLQKSPYTAKYSSVNGVNDGNGSVKGGFDHVDASGGSDKCSTEAPGMVMAWSLSASLAFGSSGIDIITIKTHMQEAMNWLQQVLVLHTEINILPPWSPTFNIIMIDSAMRVLAEGGDGPALLYMALVSLRTHGDHISANIWLQRASLMQLPFAHFLLGEICYTHSLIVTAKSEMEFDRAIVHWNTAARGLDAQAWYRMAWLMMSCRRGPADFNQVLHAHSQAICLGHSRAQQDIQTIHGSEFTRIFGIPHSEMIAMGIAAQIFQQLAVVDIELLNREWQETQIISNKRRTTNIAETNRDHRDLRKQQKRKRQLIVAHQLKVRDNRRASIRRDLRKLKVRLLVVKVKKEIKVKVATECKKESKSYPDREQQIPLLSSSTSATIPRSPQPTVTSVVVEGPLQKQEQKQQRPRAHRRHHQRQGPATPNPVVPTRPVVSPIVHRPLIHEAKTPTTKSPIQLRPTTTLMLTSFVPDIITPSVQPPRAEPRQRLEGEPESFLPTVIPDEPGAPQRGQVYDPSGFVSTTSVPTATSSTYMGPDVIVNVIARPVTIQTPLIPGMSKLATFMQRVFPDSASDIIKYTEVMSDQEIDYDAAMLLKDSDLLALGIKMGPRLKILDAIANC